MTADASRQVQTSRTTPLTAWCTGCELHWTGDRSARLLGRHVRDTGHVGYGLMRVRFDLSQPDVPAEPSAAS